MPVFCFLMKKIILSCKNVKKDYTFGLRLKRACAIKDLSFSMEEGEVLGIVGPNGAGKSTTLQVLLGFVHADSGEILLYDKNPMHPEVRSKIGFLPENSGLYQQLSVRDHLNFAAKIAGMPRKKTNERIMEILNLVGLSHVADIPVRYYSKGMTQRAALANALFLEPELLILDEPMSGLDPLGRQLVIDIINEYKQKEASVLFCSHILTDVERLCDRVAIMNKGEIAAIFQAEDLVEEGQALFSQRGKSPLEKHFLKIIRVDQHENNSGNCSINV